MNKVLRNIAILLFFAMQVFLLVERGFHNSSSEPASTKQEVYLETLSTPSCEGEEVLLNVNDTTLPQEESPIFSNKTESRLVEFNHYRAVTSNFSLVEKINDTVTSTRIRCYADKYPFSESSIEDGHFSHFKQFRI